MNEKLNSIITQKIYRLGYYLHRSDEVCQRIQTLIFYEVFIAGSICIYSLEVFVNTSQHLLSHLLSFLLFLFSVVTICIIEGEKKQLEKGLEEEFDNF